MGNEWEIPEGVKRKINETPELLSLLYDANLLPEQVDSQRSLVSLLAVVRAYRLGAAS